ncbi:MAG TPA: ABC transporter ATP-binding protein [Actinomycetota bacterium]|nr:ABC transporter ATP-binding protein [Actinomycetota bacterium]
MLEIRDLRVYYGAACALDGVSLDADDASITAVLGANGAGKTTLLRAISGLLRPPAGSIRYEGKELIGLAPDVIARLGIAHVPEGRGVIEELTVEENLRLGGLWRTDRADQKRAMEEVLALFPPLEPRRRQHALSLSGGERQMLVIGRALMARPRLLLLDEPSLGLAPLVVAQIMALLRRLCDESKITVLLVEQNARSALSVAEKGVVLNLGSVVVTERADALARDEDLRHAYLGF